VALLNAEWLQALAMFISSQAGEEQEVEEGRPSRRKIASQPSTVLKRCAIMIMVSFP